MNLPINIEELLRCHNVESNRIEFKKGWNPDKIYRTICAFANDFDNTGGGYIVVGVEEENGVAKRPVIGIPDEQLDKIQREILQFNNLMQPVYYPRVYVEEVDGNKIIVIWAMAGLGRPYKVPEYITNKTKVYQYYIRYNTSSIVAKGELETELISLSNQTPFDDRPNLTAKYEDISILLIRDYLTKVKSKLVTQLDRLSVEDLLEQMDLLCGPKEKRSIKNLAVMMFCEYPEKFFPYSQVDIVHFSEGKVNNPDNMIEVPSIKGPVPSMITSTLNYLKTNVVKENIRKIKGQEESIHTFNYPYQALEEAVVNALFHRDYKVQEPVEIVIEPDRVSIVSYSGPDRSINQKEITAGINLRCRRYRNRRLGEYLKELKLTEGRGTGIPTIQRELRENGSEKATFETDDERTYFLVDIPCHKDFIYKKEIPIDNKVQSITQTILEKLVESDMSRSEILDLIGVKDYSYNRKKYIAPLLNDELIEKTKEKGTSPDQSYKITYKGLTHLKGLGTAVDQVIDQAVDQAIDQAIDQAVDQAIDQHKD